MKRRQQHYVVVRLLFAFIFLSFTAYSYASTLEHIVGQKTAFPVLVPIDAIFGPDTVCKGDQGVYYYIQTDGGVIDYTWILPDSAIKESESEGGDTIMVDFGTAESGFISVVHNCDGETCDTIKKFVTILDYPASSSVEQKSSTMLVCNDTTQNDPGLQYNWGYTEKGPSGDVISVTGWDGEWYCRYADSIDLDENEYWLLTAFISDQQRRCTTPSYFDPELTDIEERVLNPALHVFPNPAHEKIIIMVDNLQLESVLIEVCDLNGKALFQKELQYPYHKTELSLNELNQSPGIYLIILRTGEHLVVRKLLITN